MSDAHPGTPPPAKDPGARPGHGRASDGTYRLHLIRATALRDARGAVTKWFGTCTDIHDRRQLIAETLRLEARELEMRQIALRADVSASLSKNDDLRTMLQGC